MNPKYPVYIISKGRFESRYTSKALEKMNVPYHIVIEPQEYNDYAAVINPNKIYVLPNDLRQNPKYAIPDQSGICGGGIPARNWVWEHSISIGAERHWIMDDNIKHFQRKNNSDRIYVSDGTIFKAMEDFVDRYENIAFAGPDYFFMGEQCLTREAKKPFLQNTRIYSCILIKNDLPYRWRGRYNEDTDLSLRALKDGWCTIQFRAFLQGKSATMTMKGGNTEALYKLDNEDGRLLMAKSLQAQHPDVTKIIRKWGRWQHQVDYRPFKNNRLIKKEGLEIPQGVNNYGMVLKRLDTKPTP
jgi:hypothetical protein